MEPNISSGVNANQSTNGYDYDLEWIITQSLSIPLGLFALYLAISQTIYCIWERRNRKKSRKQKHGFLLSCILALAAISAFMRAGIDFRLTLGRNTDLGCDVAIKFKLFNYVFSLCALYMLLWLRQMIFYGHDSMKFLNSRLTDILRWTVAVFMVIGIGSTLIIFLVAGKYIGHPLGCVIVKTPLDRIRWLIMIATLVSSQLLLLGLFIYPLVKHKLRSNIGKPKSNKRDSVITLIKRTTAATGVCVATDVTFALIILKLGHEIVTLSTFLYDVNIVVNVVSVICSFQNWEQRLLPCHRMIEKQNDQIQTGSTQSGRLTSDVSSGL